MPRAKSTILTKGCVCGHGHQTHRGESVEMCLDCSCMEFAPRCQNCGEEAVMPSYAPPYGRDVCSRRCALQLEYLDAKAAA